MNGQYFLNRKTQIEGRVESLREEEKIYSNKLSAVQNELIKLEGAYDEILEVLDSEVQGPDEEKDEKRK